MFRSYSVYVLSYFSPVQLFATLWAIVCQAPLSMGFSRQETGVDYQCLPPQDLPNLGTEPTTLLSNPHWQVGSLPLEPLGKPRLYSTKLQLTMLACLLSRFSCAQHFVNLWSIATRCLCGDSLGKNAGMGCHVFLQGIFLTQGLNTHLLHLRHCMQILHH